MKKRSVSLSRPKDGPSRNNPPHIYKHQDYKHVKLE